MKRIGKIIALILSAVILISIVGTVSAEETTKDTTKDTEVVLTSVDYSVANKLKAIGIISEIDRDSMVRTISRRECAELMVSMLNIPIGGADYDKSPFIDVAPSSDGMVEITTLFNMGFVSRGEDLKFNPDNKVTINEAIAFVVKAMGYRVMAESKGGYPAGYIGIANRYDLIKNINPTGNIRVYEMYHMIEKALEAPAYTYAGTVGDEDYYSQNMDVTILKEYHNMYHVKGIVTADSFSQLYSESKGVAGDQIAIDGKIYELGENAINDFLGKTVVSIVKTVDDSEDIIVYIEEDSKNVSYTLEFDELLPAKTTNQKIAYLSNDKEKYHDLDANCHVIYNGLNWGGYYNIREVLPTYGTVELLDNNKDGNIDVLRVSDYRNIVVSYIDEYDSVIYDKNDSVNDFTYSDESKLRIYDSETMQKLSVNELLYNDVLSIAISKDGEYATGYVSRRIENGKIEEITSSTPVLYKIGNSTYEVAPNTSLNLSIGTSGIFRIDYSGRIAEYEVDAGNQGGFTLAVLAGVQNNGGFRGVDLKLFNHDGTFSILTAKEKVLIDGARKDTTENSTVGLMTARVGEIVRYKVSEEKVSELDFAYITNYASGETGIESFGSLTELASGTSIKHRNGIFSVGGVNFYMSLDVETLFLVPDDLSYEEGYDVVTPNSQLSNGHNYHEGTVGASIYNHAMRGLSVKAYNLGNDGNTYVKGTAVMMRSKEYDEGVSSSNAGKGGSLTLNVVTEITDAYDFDNSRICKRIYFNDGSYRNVADRITIQYGDGAANSVLNATLADANLRPGDVITFNPAQSTITTIKVWYRMDRESTYNAVLKNTSSTVNATSFDGERMYVAATITHIDAEEKIISYTTLDGTKKWMLRYSTPTILMVRDDINERRTVELIDARGLRKGDRIVFYSNLVNASMFVAYRD